MDNYDDDFFHLGNELLISYTIRNQSSSGDINNLIQLIIPAGTNQGVIRELLNNDRFSSVDVQANQTVFEGGFLPPGQVTTVDFYSSLPTLGQADAQAMSADFIPFPSQAVVVPVSVGPPWPVPGVASVGWAATNGPVGVVTLRCTNVVAGLNYAVERSGTLGGTNWTVAGSLSVSPAPYLTSAEWSEAVTNAAAGFYRIKLTPP